MALTSIPATPLSLCKFGTSSSSSSPYCYNKPLRSSAFVITNATKPAPAVCKPLPPDRPLWFPGSSAPAWLNGSLPGDFGFDPLGLGLEPEQLKWMAQAELMHARWAMLATAGILIPEAMVRVDLLDNFNWYDAGANEYFADPVRLFMVQMGLMGWAEGRRWADMVNPGFVDIEPVFPHKSKHKAVGVTPEDCGSIFGGGGTGRRSP